MSTPVADRLAQEAQTILEKRIADNQLNLPPPPSVVMKAMAMLRDPSFSAKDASSLIECDSIIAVCVLWAANLVQHSSGEKARSLP